jgi:hypothetical protein
LNQAEDTLPARVLRLFQTRSCRNECGGEKQERKYLMHPLIHLKKVIPTFLIALCCFGLLSKAEAVVPAPDGGYPGGNTAEGQNALLSRTTGGFNTALGWFSLKSLTTGSYNTGWRWNTRAQHRGSEYGGWHGGAFTQFRRRQ